MALRSVLIPKAIGSVTAGFKNPSSGVVSVFGHSAHGAHGAHGGSSASGVKAVVSGGQIKLNKSYVAPPSTILSLQRRGYASAPAAGVVKAGGDPVIPPDAGTYRKDASKYDENSSRAFSYFMIGSLATVTTLGMKNMVTDYIVTLAASADVLAMAKVEVDLSTIPEGKNVIVKWRGKPVMIRHRTAAEIDEANSVSITELRDPQTDAERTKNPEWLVMLGVCTHLGCVPIGEAGDYGGWFCPCHGSHYDISGRIRKGPAPLNLEIPEYYFNDEGKLVVG